VNNLLQDVLDDMVHCMMSKATLPESSRVSPLSCGQERSQV